MLKQIIGFLMLMTLANAHNQLLYPKSKACFFEDMKRGDQFAVSFQVGNRDRSSAEVLEVDFWVTDPYDRRLYDLSRVGDGDVTLDIQENGRYQYCFSNEFSSIGTKDVTFHIHGVMYIDNEDAPPDSLDAEVKKMGRLMQDVKNEQGYIVIRERTHRNTAESTNSRVKWWSIFQLIVVAANSVFQIYYLKRFFEVKSNV